MLHTEGITMMTAGARDIMMEDQALRPHHRLTPGDTGHLNLLVRRVDLNMEPGADCRAFYTTGFLTTEQRGAP